MSNNKLNECVFDDSEEIDNCRKKALAMIPHIDPQCCNLQDYLEEKVVPILMEGLINVSKIRPSDPLEYLAYYLLDNNKN